MDPSTSHQSLSYPNNNNNASTSDQSKQVLKAFKQPQHRIISPIHVLLYDYSMIATAAKKYTFQTIRRIEEGVRIIEEILQKNILCRNDVEEINEAYRAIDLLERRIEQISKHSSQNALQKISDKVKKIALAEKITPANLISLYHLQIFSDKELSINNWFKIAFSKFRKHQKASKTLPLISLAALQRLFLMRM